MNTSIRFRLRGDAYVSVELFSHTSRDQLSGRSVLSTGFGNMEKPRVPWLSIFDHEAKYLAPENGHPPLGIEQWAGGLGGFQLPPTAGELLALPDWHLSNYWLAKPCHHSHVTNQLASTLGPTR